MTAGEEIAWKGIQQKDGLIFQQYYKEHYKSFFLVACKYLREAGLAQEVVNDVFVKLWEDGDKISIESSLSSYIYRAVINRSINILNKQKKDRLHEIELSKRPEEHAELRHMEENELKVRLYKAIDALPEQCRKVFMMSRFEEMKQKEIADRLGISIKTVKNHITRALKQLAMAIGKADTPLLLMMILKEFFFNRH